MPVQTNEFSFPSACTQSEAHCVEWLDSSLTPKGIVQIAHGMSEHIDRYDEFARHLASRGFIVAGQDHIGHGKSVNTQEGWGHMPLKDGDKILVENAQTLRALTQNKHGEQLPYFLFGHSMGSYMLRCYLARYGMGLSGAIICGTGFVAPTISKAGNALCKVIAAIKGEGHKSKLVDNMVAGGFNKAIEKPRTELDWLSHNQENVDSYINDERCGFMFTVGAYATLTSMTATACSLSCAKAYPTQLPLLFVSGQDDPVGDNGAGVKKAAELARKAGVEDVTVKLYEHVRHEILNEDGKQQVMDDISVWLESRL